MRITILAGAIPSTTFIERLVRLVSEAGFDITVIGKQAGAYSCSRNVTSVIVPEGLAARLFFIARLSFLTGFRHWGKIIGNSKDWKNRYNDLLFYLPIIYSRPEKIHIQWTAFIHNRDLLFELYPGRILVSMRGAHINYTPVTTPAIKESYQRLFPKVYRFHAVSKAIAKEAEQYGASSDRTDVIYSCVDKELLQYTIKPRKKSEVLHIISVGRFFWKKGYEYAIDALHILKINGVLFRYTLIAEGETPDAIKYQVHQTGLAGEITIINGMAHPEVLKEIERHDILLLPSVEEGIANVVLEAMAIGTPVISTNVGGMNEIIQEGETGYLVPPRDVQAIAAALDKFNSLLVEERWSIAEAAKKYVAENHHPGAFRKRFTAFYNS